MVTQPMFDSHLAIRVLVNAPSPHNTYRYTVCVHCTTLCTWCVQEIVRSLYSLNSAFIKFCIQQSQQRHSTVVKSNITIQVSETMADSITLRNTFKNMPHKECAECGFLQPPYMFAETYDCSEVITTELSRICLGCFCFQHMERFKGTRLPGDFTVEEKYGHAYYQAQLIRRFEDRLISNNIQFLP